MSVAATSFENVNLNEVDPQGMKIPMGQPFTFVVTEGSIKDYTNANGSGSYASIKFTITDNDTFSGRSFYKTLFPDKEGGKNATARQMRILSDATGVAVESGQIADLLPELVAQRATFVAPLEERPDAKGGKPRVEPVLWKAQPAN